MSAISNIIPGQAKAAVFQSERLASIAFSFCPQQTLSCLKHVSHTFRNLGVVVAKSQLANLKQITLRELQDFKRVLSAPTLTHVLDLMPHLEQAELTGDIFGQIALGELEEISKSKHCKNWRKIILNEVQLPLLKSIAQLCPNLEALTIKGRVPNDIAITDFIRDCPTLKSLVFVSDNHFKPHVVAAKETNHSLEIFFYDEPQPDPWELLFGVRSYSFSHPKEWYFTTFTGRFRGLNFLCAPRDLAALKQTCASIRNAIDKKKA